MSTVYLDGASAAFVPLHFALLAALVRRRSPAHYRPPGVYLLLQLCCLQGIAGVKLRRQMRNDFGLDGNDLNACASYTICSCLSVIQDANEYQMQADASLRAAPGQQAMTK